MKVLDFFTLSLVIVGGLNWGLVGLFGFDILAASLGEGSLLARPFYVFVGVSAVWQMSTLLDKARPDRPAQSNSHDV